MSGKFRTMQSQIIQRMPKVELHLHLDGSLSSEFVENHARSLGISLPVPSSELSDFSRRRDRKTMGTSLKIFDFFLQFLQTKESLEEATLDLCNRLVEYNVKYAEIRFCPALHCKSGLTSREALDAVCSGFRKGPLPGGIIVCGLRSMGSEHSVEMVQIASEGGALAFDLAGNEQDFPLSSHESALDLCKELNLPITVHAGEWPGSIENVRYALSKGVQRIGHGCELALDEDLMSLARDANVCVECCPIANVGGNKANFEDHPIIRLHKFGVPVSLSSDNLMVSGNIATGPSNPNTNIQKIFYYMPLTMKDLHTITISSLDHIFADCDVTGIRNDIMKDFEAIDQHLALQNQSTCDIL